MKENEIRVGNKENSAYLNAVLHIFNNNSGSTIHIRGLGSQGEKAIEVAEKESELVPALDFDRIESIKVDGVQGHDAILRSKGGEPRRE
ncbi:hypothetical protein AKJ40_01760 [candidate division MSBL1 archaeon SCGC-AAA259M10]|uniref:DNA/RNA-binding protein Alba-like domain-containing protein n=1 Tax=candidate division MSBL1 archaeon SCGC-AAA259M10 TaxID=1698270 RepID=A0A133V177_9EURY|nr:hypothetical protein AKJ40_01760 [candidate division MSBL1 archaeon SCGC-AAA259M10]